MQRIAVKIVIDDTDGLGGRLVPGMSVETSVDARGRSALMAQEKAPPGGLPRPAQQPPRHPPAAPRRRRPSRRHRRPLQPPFRGSGLVAVLMGTFISTLNGRLSSFGLADIRGAVSAGFDEGAWITTAQTSAADVHYAVRDLDGRGLRAA